MLETIWILIKYYRHVGLTSYESSNPRATIGGARIFVSLKLRWGGGKEGLHESWQETKTYNRNQNQGRTLQTISLNTSGHKKYILEII